MAVGTAGGAGKNGAPLLRAAGHAVFTPTLTGLGDRAHLLGPEITLQTHVEDVVSMLEAEDLREVVLVAHSYGGMVMTVVAERLADRLTHLVYLDAFVLQDGQALADLADSAFYASLEARANAEGDGEITFCGAIEMGGWIDFGVDLIKRGCDMYGITQAMFQPGPVEPSYSEFLVFEGISVEDDGTQRYNDVTLAYRRACLHAINYLKNFGYSGEQVCTILSTAPVEGRVSGVVDIPNACVSLYIPTAIFDFDIRPNAQGPKKVVKGGDLARAN